ncbi:MAG: VPLPA-CTERM sorting domain-containing protein [Sneathiella sp.]|nr:VPLPA-CTERM sorting domain-containing protein [Sneathiella sp.]
MLSKLFLVVVGAAAFMATQAHAITVDLNYDTPAFIVNPSPTTISGTVEINAMGDAFNYFSPFNDNVSPYHAVRELSSASYLFDTNYSAVSFLWGTVDGNNTNRNLLELYSGDTKVLSLFGNNIIDAVDFADVNFIGDGVVEGEFVNISISNLLFDRIVFSSTGNSFEFSNLQVVTAVPLPAALPLYGAGIAVLGFVGWRKRQKAVLAA